MQKIKQLAQSQATKLLLLNKISNLIRMSINMKDILKSTLKELELMFNAFKAYYAEKDGANFVIKVSSKRVEVGKTIVFDNDTNSKILDKLIVCNYCLREYNGAEPFTERVQRLIVPVYHQKDQPERQNIYSNRLRGKQSDI